MKKRQMIVMITLGLLLILTGCFFQGSKVEQPDPNPSQGNNQTTNPDSMDPNQPSTTDPDNPQQTIDPNDPKNPDQNEDDHDGTEEGVVDFDIEYNNKRYKLKSNMESILLIGIDKMETNVTGDGYRNGNVADFLVLVVIDHNTGSEQAIQINRECMVSNKVLGVGGDASGVKYQQICLAYTYGSGGSDSCINTCEAVSRLLNGITVNHYVRTTMDSVAIINDAVGGVSVTIPYDMTAVDESWTKGAVVTLNGSQALNFCRARQVLSEGTNINRMYRQRIYLQALIQKLQGNTSLSGSLVAEVSSHLISDLSNSRLSSLLSSGVLANSGYFHTLSGTYSWGNNGAQFAVDYDDMMSLVLRLYYTEV